MSFHRGNGLSSSLSRDRTTVPAQDYGGSWFAIGRCLRHLGCPMRTVFIVIGTSSSLEATIWVPSGIPSSVLFQVGRQDGPHEPSMSYTRKYLPHSHLQSLTLSGCIPVLFGDQTHHPFWDFLDWTKFSVNIPDNQVNRLEEILLSYTWLEMPSCTQPNPICLQISKTEDRSSSPCIAPRCFERRFIRGK
jgi:hypothetical protein